MEKGFKAVKVNLGDYEIKTTLGTGLNNLGNIKIKKDHLAEFVLLEINPQTNLLP